MATATCTLSTPCFLELDSSWRSCSPSPFGNASNPDASISCRLCNACAGSTLTSGWSDEPDELLVAPCPAWLCCCSMKWAYLRMMSVISQAKPKASRSTGAVHRDQPENWFKLVSQAGIVDFRRRPQEIPFSAQTRNIPRADGDEQPFQSQHGRIGRR